MTRNPRVPPGLPAVYIRARPLPDGEEACWEVSQSQEAVGRLWVFSVARVPKAALRLEPTCPSESCRKKVKNCIDPRGAIQFRLVRRGDGPVVGAISGGRGGGGVCGDGKSCPLAYSLCDTVTTPEPTSRTKTLENSCRYPRISFSEFRFNPNVLSPFRPAAHLHPVTPIPFSHPS